MFTTDKRLLLPLSFLILFSWQFSKICLPHTSTTAFLPIFKVFSNLKTWGSHLAMSTDDRFLPQGSVTHTLDRVAYV